MVMVEVLSSELVAPAEQTPGGSIWLSNLDLAGRRGYTPTVYFFRPNGDPGFFAADAMKDSLARALVAFYPLAGRLGLDGSGRVQVNCTGEGVVFVTARSEHYSLEELMNEFVPCGEMRDLLVPLTPAPNPPCALLFVLVTRLRRRALLRDVGQHLPRSGRAGRATVLRPHAAGRAPGAVARGAVRPPGVQAGAGAGGPRVGVHVRERHRDDEQGPGGRAQGAVPGRVHVPRRGGPGVAVRVPRPRAPAGGRDAALLHGGHARAPGPAAPGGVLRQRGDPHVGVGDGGGGGVEPVGARREAGARGDEPGRRAREVAGGLPGRGGHDEPAAERHLARAPPRHQLDGHVAVRRRLPVGRAGVHGPRAHVLQRLRVRDERAGEGRRAGAGAVAGAGVHAGVQEGVRRRAGSPPAVT